MEGRIRPAQKRPKDVTFLDRADDKQSTHDYAGTFPLMVRDEAEGWIRIHDGRHEGWTPRDQWVLTADASAYFSRVVKADPTDTTALQMRGMAWRLEGKYDKAIKDFTECIRLEPSESVFHNSRGIARHDKKEYDQAVRDYDEAIRLNPKYVLAYANRGIAHANMREYGKAVRDYDEAIRLDPGFVKFFTDRGNAWTALKEYDKAIKDYDETIRLDPEYADGFINRGIAWGKKNELGKAVADFDEVLRLDPKSAFGLGCRAWADIKRKKYDQALADYEKAMALDAMDWLQREYALFLASCPEAKYRDGAKAVKLAKAAIEKAGADVDWEFQAALAAALAETGDFDGAVKAQTAALADKHLDADDKAEQAKRLKLYEAKKPYRDE